ncbi:hypothetical protein ACTA71_003089 [Dictyostelium dimigraforme]
MSSFKNSNNNNNNKKTNNNDSNNKENNNQSNDNNIRNRTPPLSPRSVQSQLDNILNKINVLTPTDKSMLHVLPRNLMEKQSVRAIATSRYNMLKNAASERLQK